MRLRWPAAAYREHGAADIDADDAAVRAHNSRCFARDRTWASGDVQHGVASARGRNLQQDPRPRFEHARQMNFTVRAGSRIFGEVWATRLRGHLAHVVTKGSETSNT